MDESHIDITDKFFECKAGKWHRVLARYFTAQSLFLDDDLKYPNTRKLVEQPWQQTMAGMQSQVSETLTDFSFLHAKVTAGLLKGLSKDYAFYLETCKTGLKDSRFNIYNKFFNESLHLLRRGNREWPTEKILLQAALEHGNKSPVAGDAAVYLENANSGYPYLKRVNLEQWEKRSPLLTTFEGHKASVDGGFEMDNNCLLSWSKDDRTLRLWDKKGFVLRTVKPYEDPAVYHGYMSCLKLKNNFFVTQTQAPDSIILWDEQLHLKALLNGHDNNFHVGTPNWLPNKVLELSNGNLVTTEQNDSQVRLWDSRGRLLKAVNHHKSQPRVYELSSQRLISFDFIDGFSTYYLWDLDFNYIGVFTQGENLGALQELSNGLIGINSDDGGKKHQLKIFDSDGNFIKALEGHTFLVKTTLLQNGKIITDSSYEKILWNPGLNNPKLLEKNKELIGDRGTFELSDGSILTWYDSNLCFWDNQGNLTHGFNADSTITNVLEINQETLLISTRDLILLDIPSRECLSVLSGHTQDISGILKLSDGKLLSWSSDRTMKLWDIEIKHKDNNQSRTRFTDILKVDDNKVLSWSDKGLYCLWDTNGRLLKKRQLGNQLKKQGFHYFSHPFQLKDNKFFVIESYKDECLSLWDTDLNLISIITEVDSNLIYQHKSINMLSNGNLFVAKKQNPEIQTIKGELVSVLSSPENNRPLGGLITEFSNGDLLIKGGGDNSFSLFNNQGSLLAEYTGQSFYALDSGVIELSHTRIVSWENRILRLWDRRGNLVKLMEGHTADIRMALELSDGTILSFSTREKDKTVRLWDASGTQIGVWQRPPLRFFSREWRETYSFGANDAIKLADDRVILISALEYKTVHLWDRNFPELQSFSFDEAILKFPELGIHLFFASSQNHFLFHTDTAHQTKCRSVWLKNLETGDTLYWHGSTDCRARLLEKDGTAVLIQDNGDICFLKPYWKNKRVTLEELKELL